MYTNYWSLKQKPFTNTPDHQFLYYSAEHEEALIRMLYVATEENGALLLTGGVGCGKTLISRVFINELNQDHYDVALVTNPALSGHEFVREVLYQLGIDAPDATKLEAIHLLNERVYDNARRGRHTIIVIDEAQVIKDKDTLEEIRLLLNFQQNDKFYISLILMGQPELQALVDSVPQLRQRLGVRYHLGPLSLEDTQHYIDHRLRVAGSGERLFTPEAFKMIHKASEGVPRNINNLCDMALLVGFGQKATAVSADIAKQVITDLHGV